MHKSFKLYADLYFEMIAESLQKPATLGTATPQTLEEEALQSLGFIRVPLIEHDKPVQTAVYQWNKSCEFAQNVGLLISKGLEEHAGPYAMAFDVRYKVIAKEARRKPEDTSFCVIEPTINLYTCNTPDQNLCTEIRNRMLMPRTRTYRKEAYLVGNAIKEVTSFIQHHDSLREHALLFFVQKGPSGELPILYY